MTYALNVSNYHNCEIIYINDYNIFSIKNE